MSSALTVVEVIRPKCDWTHLPRRQVYGVTFFSSNSLAFVSYLRTDKAASVRPHLPTSQ